MSYFSLIVMVHIKHLTQNLFGKNLKNDQKRELGKEGGKENVLSVLENNLKSTLSCISNTAFAHMYSIEHQSQEMLQENMDL